jgi:hypothetical protein
MYYARYEDLMAVTVTAIFWDVTPGSLLPTFRRKLLPHPSRYRVKSSSGLKKEASGYSTTLVILHLTRQYIQEDSNLQERTIMELD